MLIAKPHRPFAKDFAVYRGGTLVARVEPAHFRERGTITTGDDTYLASRASFWGGRFTLSCDAEVLVTAQQRGIFSRQFDLELGARTVVLKPISWFQRGYQLDEGSEPLGTITRRSWLSRETTIDLPEDLPVPIQLFLFWIVSTLWRRTNHAS